MTDQDFDSKLRALGVSMTADNYDRYKLVALHKKEIGVAPKRGAPVEDIVSAIIAHHGA